MATDVETDDTALHEGENPFAAFTEWGGPADDEAYAEP